MCQHHHQVVRVGHFVGLSEIGGTRCSRLHRPIRPKPSLYFVNNPGAPHHAAAVRVLLYLKNNSTRKLHFQPVSTRPLRIFSDSDWAVKFSVSGGVFEVMGCAVHWYSKVQRSVSMSSTEAEWFAAMVAEREGMYLCDLLTELGVSLLGATAIRSDKSP